MIQFLVDGCILAIAEELGNFSNILDCIAINLYSYSNHLSLNTRAGYSQYLAIYLVIV